MTDIYVTKYALSDGITVRKEDHREDQYIWVEWSGTFNGKMMLTKGEWFESKDAALENANSRRAKKIASLKKQIAKLEAMTFAID